MCLNGSVPRTGFESHDSREKASCCDRRDIPLGCTGLPRCDKGRPNLLASGCSVGRTAESGPAQAWGRDRPDRGQFRVFSTATAGCVGAVTMRIYATVTAKLGWLALTLQCMNAVMLLAAFLGCCLRRSEGGWGEPRPRTGPNLATTRRAVPGGRPKAAVPTCSTNIRHIFSRTSLPATHTRGAGAG